uniref:enoyl-CoA hydratase domain-containing protein 3, mitochondrial isoform X3 n=1 Tax=Myxine glutinosa TaxID=7769 RepID=UPI00358EE893
MLRIMRPFMGECRARISLSATACMGERLTLRNQENGIRTIVLNDVRTRNALSLAMLESLREDLTFQCDSPDLRVIILAANGPVFCAGHDLKELRPECGRDFHVKVFKTCSENPRETDVMLEHQPTLENNTPLRLSNFCLNYRCQLWPRCKALRLRPAVSLLRAVTWHWPARLHASLRLACVSGSFAQHPVWPWLALCQERWHWRCYSLESQYQLMMPCAMVWSAVWFLWSSSIPRLKTWRGGCAKLAAKSYPWRNGSLCGVGALGQMDFQFVQCEFGNGRESA